MPRQKARARRAASGTPRPERVGNLGVIEREYRARSRQHLNAEVEQALVEALRAGNFVTNACTLAGIAQTTLYRWMKRADEVEALIEENPQREDLDDDDFRYVRLRDRLARARADAQDMAVGAVKRQMEGGHLISRRPALTSDGLPIYDDGKLVYEEQWTQPDGRLAMQFLAASFPKEWSKAAPVSRFEILSPDGGRDGERVDPEVGISLDAIGAVAARLVEMREARRERMQQIEGGPQAGDEPGDEEQGEIVDADLVEE